MLTAEDQGAAVGSREMHVEHLDGGELVEHGPGGEAGGERLEPCAQRDVQTVSQEGDEDVRLDTVLELMVDRAQVQIVLQGLEGGLDLDELDVEPPQLRRVFAAQIGAQQIAAFGSKRGCGRRWSTCGSWGISRIVGTSQAKDQGFNVLANRKPTRLSRRSEVRVS